LRLREAWSPPTIDCWQKFLIEGSIGNHLSSIENGMRE
jgi:hypothetical protein